MGSLIAVWCVILMEGTAIFAAKECPNDNYKVNINKLPICCQPCKPSANSQVCADGEERELECQCSQGYGCKSQGCTTCEKLPVCDKTSWLKRLELQTSVFQYNCEKCPTGTFFEAESGICKPDKTQISTTTSSKDGIYSTVSSTPNPERSSFNNWTSLYLYLGLTAFILLVITIVTHLIIWKMKAAQLLKIAGEPFQPHLINRNAKEADSWSCQYPEEEHGEEHGIGPPEKQYV